MRVAEIQKLIDKPLHPNPTEWAMDVEDVLVETNNLSENAKTAMEKPHSCLQVMQKSQPKMLSCSLVRTSSPLF